MGDAKNRMCPEAGRLRAHHNEALSPVRRFAAGPETHCISFFVGAEIPQGTLPSAILVRHLAAAQPQSTFSADRCAPVCIRSMCGGETGVVAQAPGKPGSDRISPWGRQSHASRSQRGWASSRRCWRLPGCRWQQQNQPDAGQRSEHHSERPEQSCRKSSRSRRRCR